MRVIGGRSITDFSYIQDDLKFLTELSLKHVGTLWIWNSKQRMHKLPYLNTTRSLLIWSEVERCTEYIFCKRLLLSNLHQPCDFLQNSFQAWKLHSSHMKNMMMPSVFSFYYRITFISRYHWSKFQVHITYTSCGF